MSATKLRTEGKSQPYRSDGGSLCRPLGFAGSSASKAARPPEMTHEKAGQGCEAPRPALGCVAVAADTPENKTGPITSQARPSWRDVLPVHPDADHFPMMDSDDLKALGDDIKANGLTHPVVLDDRRRHLLDGRNRLDAMAMVGIEVVGADSTLKVATVTVPAGTDPFDYIISANIHRRHLSREKKHEVVAEMLKANPERSNRQIAELLRIDHKTVGAVREREERRGSIPHVSAAKDKLGRTQVIKKPKINVAEELEANRERIYQRLRLPRKPPLSNNSAARDLRVHPRTIQAARDEIRAKELVAEAVEQGVLPASFLPAAATEKPVIKAARDGEGLPLPLKFALDAYRALPEDQQARFLDIVQAEWISAKPNRDAIQSAADRAEARAHLRGGSLS